ncbi:6112_t:CDS:2 [Paraglomus occultum]|uniref:6112_t:CDS:1 n=1 Tax=Paraglomus occultum TaxID=144539 RepID=A0A9N9BEA6_9GLOM|nr:6112_t:CDS:2 [Paraglomus occultum]
MDLLEYAQKLVAKGDNNQSQNAQYLQTLIQQGDSPVKDNKQPGNNTSLLVGGLVVFGISAMDIYQEPDDDIGGILAAKFPLNPANKKNDQLKINKPLALIANNEEKPAKKEAILLQKIKLLEEQLKYTQQLVQQEKQRADQLEIKLKVVGKFLYQQQKINYYKQLEKEQEAKIEQPLLKPPNK